MGSYDLQWLGLWTLPPGAHEAALGHVNDEGRVVEVTGAALEESSGHGLEHLAAQPDRVAPAPRGNQQRSIAASGFWRTADMFAWPVAMTAISCNGNACGTAAG
jgi:hypothetical protein